VVRDVNDNWPQFTSASRAAVSEDASVGSSVFQLAATDADLDDSGRVAFSLETGEGSSVFSVGSSDGVVSVRRQLDRETKDRYELMLVATDAGSPARSTSVILTVDVVDANDHSPVFSPSRYVTTVSEETPIGSLVATVSAVDADRGLNAEVRYDVISGDEFGVFAVDGFGGEISVRRALSRRWRSDYTLTVVARDLGTPPRSSTATVVVSVVGGGTSHRRRTASAPLFLTSPYIGRVVENQPAPVHVTRVSALTDDDVKVTYAFADDREVGNIFAVNASTGHVTTAAILDRERTDVYTFNVIAVTSGAYQSLSMY